MVMVGFDKFAVENQRYLNTLHISLTVLMKAFFDGVITKARTRLDFLALILAVSSLDMFKSACCNIHRLPEPSASYPILPHCTIYLCAHYLLRAALLKLQFGVSSSYQEIQYSTGNGGRRQLPTSLRI